MDIFEVSFSKSHFSRVARTRDVRRGRHEWPTKTKGTAKLWEQSRKEEEEKKREERV